MPVKNGAHVTSSLGQCSGMADAIPSAGVSPGRTGCKLHKRSIGGDMIRAAAAPTCDKGLLLTMGDDDDDDDTARSSSVNTDAPMLDDAEST